MEQEHTPAAETTEQSSQTQDTPPNETKTKEEEYIDKVVIPMWPKTPVLYPLAVYSLICCLVGMFFGMSSDLNQIKKHFAATAAETAAEQAVEGDELGEAGQGEAGQEGEQAAANQTENSGENLQAAAQSMVRAMVVDRIMGVIFLVLFALTLFTLCFDMEVRWALVVFCSIIIVGLVLYILNLQYGFMPTMLLHLFALSPMATPQFYATIFGIWVILMLISFGVVQFHYVKIESNEVIVVGGLLERQQRYSTIRMQYVRDIQDVLEYYLPFVNSGRLILTFPDQRDSVVIENVLHIDKVTHQLDKLSGIMQVRS